MQRRIGVEIELLAPRGATRADLAQALAEEHGGVVRKVLHQDSEPSKVTGQPIFYNLTQGFEALDGDGRLLARCVDDLTLQVDLDRGAPPKPGWWRVVSDDERLLRLLALHIDPECDLPAALSALAPLFRGALLPAPGGVFRLVDAVGAPLAIAAPLPGERERPCELVTPPLAADHAARLERLLATARRLGFGVPVEGATHLHFDAAPLCSAHVIANLVNLLWAWGPRLRRLCGTPASFRRVGGWPASLHACVNAADFRILDWPAAQARLRALELSKFCDFNLKNIAYGRVDRHTFEVRILAATLDTAAVMAGAVLFERILDRCQRAEAVAAEEPAPWRLAEAEGFIAGLELEPDAQGLLVPATCPSGPGSVLSLACQVECLYSEKKHYFCSTNLSAALPPRSRPNVSSIKGSA